MRVVNADFFGWEKARTARVRGVLKNSESAGELVWLSVPEGPYGDPIELIVRPRIPTTRWRAPRQGERLEVLAWTADEAAIEDFEVATELGLDLVWHPPASASVRVLWVEG